MKSSRRADRLITTPHRSFPSLLAAALLVIGCSGDAGLLGPSANGESSPRSPGSSSPPVVPVATGNAIAGARMWVDPLSRARRTADGWRATRPRDAEQMDKIAAQPQAIWFGDWNTDVARDVADLTTTITARGALPVYVAYNIPQRDCGGYSGGNGVTPARYGAWIGALAAGLAGRRAVVVLEPDALASIECLRPEDQRTRLDLLRSAITTLTAAGALVYVDAGNAEWLSAATMAQRLSAIGVESAAGFALNVSNFLTTEASIRYGQQLSALVNGKHFLIDTSRNGLGGNGDWCNPDGRALGARPTTTATGSSLVDALLWIKSPGESDGTCHGGPAAGEWMPEYALGLAQRASY